jgi:5-deoxy-glucuronate isomerase
MNYTADNLLVRPGNSSNPDVVVDVTPELAGWEHIWFQLRRLHAGASWSFETGPHELAIVPLGGTLSVETSRGSWTVGGRPNVFAGKGHALYLPRQTSLKATASGECEFAVAWVHTEADHSPKLVTPDEVAVEIRGGDNATRQINGLLPPGFPCDRLVIVEVYTPSGSWSSYPPHKHDVHRVAVDGTLLEADLEEIYAYKINPPEGFAIQRIYTDEQSPLQQAGFPIDAAIVARNNHVVLVPEGYHPVTSAPGYTTYYLNVLAGSAQSLANVDDPHHTWVKERYQGRDSRVPLY